MSESDISRATPWIAELDRGIIATDILEQDGSKTDLAIDQIAREISTIGRGFQTLFETKNHRFGSTCPHVLPGDKICLLYGGHFPFVLREVETLESFKVREGQPSQKKAYQIIGGESYVHGLMDGEGLELAAREGLSAQDICLV